MIPQSWTKGFEAARAASEYATAPHNRLKVGAALYSKSMLLAIGFNTYDVTHPQAHRTKEFHRNIHAEHRAIIKRRHYENRNLIIYTWRELADGTPGISKPCAMCQTLLREAGVRRARFINEQGKPEEILL